MEYKKTKKNRGIKTITAILCCVSLLTAGAAGVPAAEGPETAGEGAVYDTDEEILYDATEEAWSEGVPEDGPEIAAEERQEEEIPDAEEEDPIVQAAGSEKIPSVSYRTHVQNIGWQDYVRDGDLGGTTGRSLRLEGINIRLSDLPVPGGITYCTHVQNIGWQDYVSDDAMAGTEGRSLRLEAIRIRLTGELANEYDVWYQTHIQNIGWTGWAMNDEPCGSAGYSYRLEGIRILITAKGAAAPGSTAGIFFEQNAGVTDGRDTYKNTLIRYNTHVQDYGWQKSVSDGAMAGTSGESKRLEGIRISLTDVPVSGGIRYRTHVQNVGWQNYVSDGAMAGTQGRSLRLEAIQIELTGDIAGSFDVYYCVHVQDLGWLPWARNGEPAGTEGMSKRLEAIRIQLVRKGTAVSGYDAEKAFRKSVAGNGVTWIGDSYSALHESLIYEKVPNVDLQAEAGRFVSSWMYGVEPGISVAQNLKNSGKMRKTVVFALGTNSNDGVTNAELDQLRSIFGDSHKVIFVTARTNNMTYEAGNARLRAFVNRYPNYYLYDWAAYFRPEYIIWDGIHPTDTGIRVWVDGIVGVLNSIE